MKKKIRIFYRNQDTKDRCYMSIFWTFFYKILQYRSSIRFIVYARCSPSMQTAKMYKNQLTKIYLYHSEDVLRIAFLAPSVPLFFLDLHLSSVSIMNRIVIYLVTYVHRCTIVYSVILLEMVYFFGGVAFN